MTILDFIRAHWAMLLFGAYVLISAVVAATPSKADDAAWKRFCQTIAFLAPANVRGVFSLPGRKPTGDEDPVGPMLLVLLGLGAAAITGCAGRGAVAAETARASSCIAVESRCIDRAEAGEISVREAEACASCTRATCDAIRERLVSR